jgi:transcriptional regulator GlxA family with amidase domain
MTDDEPALAEQCGFSEIYRFSKVFNCLTGPSPGSYRRKHLSELRTSPTNDE